MEFLAVPSIADFKQIARDGGSLTLKEIRSVTTEKLINKIIRSFLTDIVWYAPFLMLVLLQYRRATAPETRECFGSLADWLLQYILVMGGFSLAKLLRIPILKLNYKVYVWYVLVTFGLFIAANLFLFVRGNFEFFETVTDSVCAGLDTGSKTSYNNTVLTVLSSIVLIVDWLAVLGVVQLALFLLMLWALWTEVFKASTRMREKFSVRSLIESILNTVGEGQIQDSITIGFIQFLLTD